MMKKFSALVSAGLAVALCAGSGAARGEDAAKQAPAAVPVPVPVMVPGLWEITARPNFAGVPMIPAPRTYRSCLSAADIQAGKVEVRAAPACKVDSGVWDSKQPKRLVVTMSCAGLTTDAPITGELIVEGKTFTGQVEIAMNGARLAYLQNGQWLGSDCTPPAVPAAPVPAPAK